MIHSLAGATVITPDLDAALRAYREYLGYDGAVETVGEARAEAWGVPQAAASRTATLHPESGHDRFIRLIEGTPAPGFRPFATYGWTAIEIVVEDVEALAERLAESPFEIIGPPAVLQFDFTDKLKAMQVVGPGGEVLYLTEIGGEIPGFALPSAGSLVDHPFIMVLASHDISASGSFYESLGRVIGPEISAQVPILSDAFGMPADQRHALATIAFDDCSLLEVDAFPETTEERPRASNGFPCGIAMVSLFAALGTALPVHPLVGPAGEWIDFVECRSES